MEQALQEFVLQTTQVAEAQKNVLMNSQEHGHLMKRITGDAVEDLESARIRAGRSKPYTHVVASMTMYDFHMCYITCIHIRTCRCDVQGGRSCAGSTRSSERCH